MISKVFESSDSEEDIQIKEFQVSCYLNLARCYMKLQEWQNAIRACDAALDADPTCVKALYHRAQVV